jgi:signal transduction histidine kinase
MHLEDYRRDWQGVQDLPYARETFGSVIATPLSYRQDTIGVLLVIAARDGRSFDRDDAYQLDLLGAQAAVAISNSHLFEEQKALAEQVELSRSQMETVLSSTPSPVLAFNRQMDIIFTNLAARDLLQEALRKLPTTLLGTALLQNPQHSVRKVLRSLRQGGHYSFELSLAGRDYLCTVTALRTATEKGFVAILNDVSELKELDRMKNEMVRMTSHDLKNPLQAALANLDLAKDELVQQPNIELEHSLDVIERQLIRMERIIRGILDVERARTGLYTFTPTEPAALIYHSVEELQHLIQTSEVEVVVRLPESLPIIAGDGEQLKRAIVNLLENALKFTPAGGRIDVSADVAGTKVLMCIADSGVGIPPEVGERVFERFYRVNQRGTEHVTGSGLGLSLVKTIIEHHHGRVWFTSEVARGTRFNIELPIASVGQFVASG